MKKLPTRILVGLRFAILFVGLCVPTVGHAALVAAWGNNTYGQTRLPLGVNNVKAIAGGDYHSLALRSDGSVLAWGLNNEGQINVPSGLANVKAIAAGNAHGLALKVNGSVVAWGRSSDGQTNVPGNLSHVVAIACGGNHNLALDADSIVIAWGNNSNSQTNVPAGLSDVIAIAAGANHSLALKADGSVVAWGNNSYGQTNVPSDLSNIVAIATRGNFNLALKADGTVVAWGHNLFDQTIVPVGLSNVTSIAAGYFHAMALRTDGTIVTWGDNTYGQAALLSGLSNVTAIAAGWYHSLALVSDGPIQLVQNPQSQAVPYTSNVTFSVVATGREPLDYHWFFNGSPIETSFRVSGTATATLSIRNLQISDIGIYAVVVRNAFGSVFSSGASLNVISPPFITKQPTNRTVRAGSDVILSAAASGTPPLSYQWNFNGTDIPFATGTTLFRSNVQPEQSGIYFMRVTNLYGAAETIRVSLTVTDSPPYLLRHPYVNQPNQSTVTNFVAPAGSDVTIRVDARGSLPLFYQWKFNGVETPGATNSTLILTNLQYDQAGYYNVEVSNAFGSTNSAKFFLNVVQVLVAGTPFANNINTPLGLSNVIAVAAGGSHVMALRSDGTVRTWLANVGSVFGSPYVYAVTNIPVSATNIMAISAGYDHCLALRSNGTVVAWGGNSFGQTNAPFAPEQAALTNVISIAAGSNRSYAVKSDGTVRGWGSQPAVPLGLSNVVAVAAGPSQNLALRRDGTVTAWGSGSLASVPPGLSNVIAIAAGSAQNRALRQDGLVVWWTSSAGSTIETDGNRLIISNAVATASGNSVSMTLNQNGTVRSSELEKLGLIVSTNISAIAAGGVQSGFGVMVIGNGSPTIALHPYSQILQKSNTVRLHARSVGVQPMQYQWLLDNHLLPGATNSSLILTNVLGKDTGAYRMIASNSLGVAASHAANLTIFTTLAAALNATNLNWNNGDQFSPAWFAQNRETHDGDAAAQSGAIATNQQTILQGTYITGPGTLTFWWKVSSEESFDFLRFYLNNNTVPIASISGETDWQQITIAIPRGDLQTLRWIYSKDSSVSAGRDAGWVDELVFTPDPPVITVQPTPRSTTASMGANLTIRVTATGLGPLSYQWLKNSATLTGATQASLTLTNLTRRNSGTFAVRVSNAGGSTLSSNATLVVRVPQRLQTPVRLADGSFLLTSDDADGGALLPEDLAAFEVQASTNLVNWVPVSGVPVVTNGSFVLRDSESTNFPVRFYRMVEH